MKHLVPALQNVRLGTIALVLALVAFAPTAYGAILEPGSVLNFSGAQVAGAVSTTFLCNQPGDPQCNPVPAGAGDFVVASSTGSFAQYDGTFGLIKDVNNAAQPLNTDFPLPNWITFDLNNQIALELTFLPLGNDPISATCAGLTHCTPQNPLLTTPNDPQGLAGFDLDQTAIGTVATFSVDGIAHASDSTSDSYSGIFTTTFVGLDPQQALAIMLAGSDQTYSGQITLAAGATAVPEPFTLSLFGAGLAGAAALRRRKKAQKA
jgi:hypothetical protein